MLMASRRSSSIPKIKYADRITFSVSSRVWYTMIVIW